ncbi:hypothetical protein SHLO109777_01770 [Shewanella loihica]
MKLALCTMLASWLRVSSDATPIFTLAIAVWRIDSFYQKYVLESDNWRPKLVINRTGINMTGAE